MSEEVLDIIYRQVEESIAEIKRKHPVSAITHLRYIMDIIASEKERRNGV